jgi:hypothetical protein
MCICRAGKFRFSSPFFWAKHRSEYHIFQQFRPSLYALPKMQTTLINTLKWLTFISCLPFLINDAIEWSTAIVWKSVKNNKIIINNLKSSFRNIFI